MSVFLYPYELVERQYSEFKSKLTCLRSVFMFTIAVTLTHTSAYVEREPYLVMSVVMVPNVWNCVYLKVLYKLCSEGGYTVMVNLPLNCITTFTVMSMAHISLNTFLHL